MKVIKRDGREEDYDGVKVIRAVEAALHAAGYSSEDGYQIGCSVNLRCYKLFDKEVDGVSVEKIHRTVEDVLMSRKEWRNGARSYIEYRKTRDNAREGKGKLYADITGFLDQSSEEFTRENANKPSTIVNTHRDLLAGILSKHVATTQILPKNLAEWHTSGYGHIHDLDYMVSPLTNCCLVNYRDMLSNGFRIGNAKIEKPKSIGVATTVLTQIIQAVASSQYGGQTCAHIDEGLKQYVEMSYNKNCELLSSLGRASKSGPMYMTDRDVYDAMQTLLYQVNTLMSVNGQSPFITISLGLDTSDFGRMITRNYLKIHKEGLGKDKVTPVFPKVVFFLQEGVNMNPGDPNYDLKKLAMECCAERIYPDFISVPLNKEVTGSSEGKVTSMGCRSFLSHYVSPVTGEEQYDGRFNLGVVSLNLPMIAAESIQQGKDFVSLLKYHMGMAYDAHMVRVGRLLEVKASQNPIMFMEGALARLGPDEYISKLFYDGYASISIGYVGLAEAVEILNGSLDKKFAMEILACMNEMCNYFKAMSGLSFSMYGTPAESLCYRFATKLKEAFPGLIERDYLTNSFHQPVWIKSDPFSKWDYESGFAMVSNGGNIGYVETCNLKNNMKALEALIDYGYNTIHYFGINQPVDQCFSCGFHGEFKATSKGFECPQCGNHEEGTISVIRRVSGYLSAPNSRPYNKGKMEEVLQREKHV